MQQETVSMIKNNQEYNKEVDELLYASDQYYNHSNSIMLDVEFDTRLKELEDYEKLHPSEKRQDSPTSNVGSIVEGKGYRHHPRMYSLQNVYDIPSLNEFLFKLKDKGVRNVIIEPKYDGASISLVYRKGKLVHMITRGDGEYGKLLDDIIPYVNVPTDSIVYDDIVVRGEFVIPISTFNKINKEREDNNEEPFKNPRNLASGTLSLLSASGELIKSRGLKMIPYQLISKFDIYANQLGALKHMGKMFEMFDTTLPHTCIDLNEFKGFNSVDQLRSFFNSEEMDVMLDGLVFKVESVAKQRELGFTSKYPRWAMAYKFEPEVATTTIRNIVYQIGRTGKITPVAEFDEVSLSGTKVQRATLNNIQFMRDKNIKVGSVVEVIKAAEIIPYITKSVSSPSDVALLIPVTCHVCGNTLINKNEQLYCTNDKCNGVLIEKLKYAAGKTCLDITSLGDVMIETLFNNSIIKEPLDLFTIPDKKSEIIKSTHVSNVILDKVIKKINIIKNNLTMDILLTSLSIPLVGKSVSRLICKHVQTIDTLFGDDYDFNTLENVNGIGAQIIIELRKYIEKNKHIPEKIKELGLNVKNVSTVKIDGILSGKTFVITGKFFDYTRDEVEEIIIQNGGRVSSSVNINTDYLITDVRKESSKFKKAKSLNKPIITLNEFFKMITT